MIKGETVVLVNRVETGHDPFGAPTFTEELIEIKNVIVGNPSTDDQVAELNLTGKK